MTHFPRASRSSAQSRIQKDPGGLWKTLTPLSFRSGEYGVKDFLLYSMVMRGSRQRSGVGRTLLWYVVHAPPLCLI